MPKPHPCSRTVAVTITRALLVMGLIVCAASFVMLDRDWLKDALPPLGPIDHTVALVTGGVGLTLLISAAYQLRRITASQMNER